MVHSGPADAQELWEQLEKRWSDLENQAKHLTRGTEDMRDGVADMVRDNVTRLRKGYDRLASELREPRSESIWSQIRISLASWGHGSRRQIRTAKLGNRDKRDPLPTVGPELAVSGSDSAAPLAQNPARQREIHG
jgi:hypothetical protein